MTRSAATSTSAALKKPVLATSERTRPTSSAITALRHSSPLRCCPALREPGAAVERRRHLPRRSMPGDEPVEEAAGIGAERPHPVAALLHHEGRVALLADHAAELLEILGAVRPGAGGIAAPGIEAERHHEEGRTEAPDAAQALGDRVAMLLRRDVLGQRDVEIVAGAGARAGLVAEAGEIRIGEARMAVDRDGEHVGAVIEDLLLAVAVVIVDVEDRDAAVARRADWRRSRRC